MGGRGASSGISIYGKKYGTEYHTIKAKDENGKDVYLKSGNIKFILANEQGAQKAPMETRTEDRIYVFVSNNKKFRGPRSIVYFDKNLKRNKQIDLTHFHNGEKPHTHLGYWHDEHGTRKPTMSERKIIAKVHKMWYNWIARYGVE